MVSQLKQCMLIGILGSSVLAITTLQGCSPLPGRTLDPVYLKLGTQPEQASPQRNVSPTPTPPPAKHPPGLESRKSNSIVWVGRYRDSRGEGGVTFSLTQYGSSVSGTWTLRTGGGGPVSGVVEADGRRLRWRMQSRAAECPGTFEGWAEITESTLVGAYHGMDCEGPVSDGWLELRAK